ncbi:MAG: hypothetical protein HN742_10605 [Lentisphaerae bacterium]|jgi:tRNA 2-thiocytidine biosynthesis protein TtcA|nr:hypothetical protein [Lentisphaerota bacterium]MBT4819331.1 hypothetical protein [Lentisphaerota bacterium]MBT5605592.1 hypothetical protein [Lentisphaerota bacterium]MBT7054009.1 hypothetical protein [Lentisphaerota bacterium]MBT7842314.1 hypothetical protein [Lentisphaerota bacterium]
MKSNRFKTIEERETFLVASLKRATDDFGILRPGAPVVVGLSGGRDSLCLVHLLDLYRERIEPSLQLMAATVLSHVQRIDVEPVRNWLNSIGVEHRAIEAGEIEEELRANGNRHACYLCSRRRRQKLCELSQEVGAAEIALGHHRLDFLETFLISAFRGGRLGCMSPAQKIFKGLFRIVRPMVYIEDVHLAALAQQRELPISKHACPFGDCGDRVQFRELLQRLEKEHRGTQNSLFSALTKPADTPVIFPTRKD